MLTIDALRSYGANVDEGLERCMKNEMFYLRLVKMALADPNFEKLETALPAGDWTGAFEAAHALKGILGNLALTPMYDPIHELTEILRPKQPCDFKALFEQFSEAKKAFAEIVTG